MAAPDDTTRRLLFAAPPPAGPASAAPPQGAPSLRVAPAAHGRVGAPGHSSAEDEAEAALRYLEAEWTMRMEAPLAALASLEGTLTQAIDAAHRNLPFQRPDQAPS
jgi:hypothetical protein